MNTSRLAPTLVIGLILVLGLSSCSTAQTVTQEALPATAGLTPTPSLTLATPYAQEPASGICASFDGETVTINLNTDISDPRCAKIRPDQKLSVVNKTLSTLRVSIGSFNRSMLPGEGWSVDIPFGDYLAPGVHQLSVYPCCGAELWLEVTP